MWRYVVGFQTHILRFKNYFLIFGSLIPYGFFDIGDSEVSFAKNIFGWV